MEVTRTSLSSYQGNTVPKQVRYAGAATKGKYGEELRENLSTLGQIKGKAPIIKADSVEAVVSDPNQYTKDAIKTALEKAALALQQGLGKDTTDSTVSPTTLGGGGGGGNKGFFSGDDLSGMSTQQLVDRDNEMYGNTFPSGSFSATDTNSMVNRDNMKYGNTFPEGSFSITKEKEKGGQGGLPLGTTTLRDGEKQEGPAVNASSFLQKNVRGSTSFDGTGKDESARPKQTVAALPSDYKSTEQKAFAAAKAYKSMTSGANVGSGAQANVGTGKDGGFGTGTYGKGRPSDSKTTNKATPTQKTAVKKATTVKKSSPSTSKSGSKSNTGSKKSSRGGSKSGGSKSGGSKSGGSSGGSKSGGSKSGGSKSGGSKSNSGSKSSARGASKSSSSKKGGTSSSKKSNTGSKKSARRCDIRCKIDISALSNLNLIKDDLADVAYFVRGLQEK